MNNGFFGPTMNAPVLNPIQAVIVENQQMGEWIDKQMGR